jgi:hypothetical protein
MSTVTRKSVTSISVKRVNIIYSKLKRQILIWNIHSNNQMFLLGGEAYISSQGLSWKPRMIQINSNTFWFYLSFSGTDFRTHILRQNVAALLIFASDVVFSKHCAVFLGSLDSIRDRRLRNSLWKVIGRKLNRLCDFTTFKFIVRSDLDAFKINEYFDGILCKLCCLLAEHGFRIVISCK